MVKLNLLCILVILVSLICIQCKEKGKSDAPVKCRNDKKCIKSGLANHYCRKRGPKILESECVPKRGKFCIYYRKLFIIKVDVLKKK